jgi:hypothetical protein
MGVRLRCSFEGYVLLPEYSVPKFSATFALDVESGVNRICRERTAIEQSGPNPCTVEEHVEQAPGNALLL